MAMLISRSRGTYLIGSLLLLLVLRLLLLLLLALLFIRPCELGDAGEELLHVLGRVLLARPHQPRCHRVSRLHRRIPLGANLSMTSEPI